MVHDTGFVINKIQIAPGKRETVRLHVARLPSGTVISIRVHVYRSLKPGPTVLVLGGVHGDEINGIEIVRRAIKRGYFNDLNIGNVIAIPLLNVYGFINFSREVAEGKDINRAFPGSAKGSLAARVAHVLTKEILPLVDFGIDFHTGGGSRYNYPQIRISAGDSKAEELARQFAPPFLIRKAMIPKTLRKSALAMGVPILVYEGGESLRLDGFSIDNGLAGLLRLMHAQGMIDSSPPILRPTIIVNKTNWVRAAQAGMFTWTQQSGARVGPKEPMGVIHDPYGENDTRVLANRVGFLIGHNNAPVVSEGDALFHIGSNLEI